MIVANLILSAFRALQRNKLRSFLTMLGIVIGVASVIAMLAIGQGAEYSVRDYITKLGTNVIQIYPGSQQQGGIRIGAGTMTTLTTEDADAIAKECPAVLYVSPGSRSGGQIVAGNLNWSTGIIGTSQDYPEIRQWKVEYGEYFTDQDVKAATKVCVLGRTVADMLFPDSDPVGQNIRIQNVPFKMIGVFEKKGQSPGADQDDDVFAPYTTVLRKLARYPYLRSIMVSAVNTGAMAAAQEQITEVLRARHKIQSENADDFTVRNQTDLAETATATSKIMTILLASIAAVSLLVGGIGIMNIMLVSVTERTREIGIRMSVGARERDILIQFLIESVSLSLTGGILGLVLGVSGSKAVSAIAQWPTIITPFTISLAFGFSIAIGIFFGFYPARKASLLNPIDALRFE